jgi:preprotein translocase subunit SecA
LFGNLFGSKDKAPADADVVWLSSAARLKGLRHDVEVLVEDENSVVVIALSMAVADELASAVEEFNPTRCMSLADAGALRAQLAKAGAVTVAMSGALPGQGKPDSEVPLEVLVCGRNDQRSADDGIVRAAAALARTSHVTFHLSLDDPLLRAHGANLKPLLEKIGMKEDEPVQHALLSRAIRNAQKE